MSASPSERAPGPSSGASAEIDRSAYPFASRWLDLAAGRMHYVDEGAGRAAAVRPRHPHLVVRVAPSDPRAGAQLTAASPPITSGSACRSARTSFPYTPEAHAGNLDDFVAKLGSRTTSRWSCTTSAGPIGLPLCLQRPGASEAAGDAQHLDVELQRRPRHGAQGTARRRQPGAVPLPAGPTSRCA